MFENVLKNKIKTSKQSVISIIISLTSLTLVLPLPIFAQSNATSSNNVATTTNPTTSPEFENLQTKIIEKNKEIEKLEAEIKAYKEDIEKTGKQQKTLQGQLKTLDITGKKLVTDITLTAKKIDATALTIDQLVKDIGLKQKAINVQQDGIRNALIKTHENDQTSTVEGILRYEKLSDFWNNQTELLDVQSNMKDRVEALISIKEDLTETKKETESKQKDLTRLKSQLADQKKIVEINKEQKSVVLKETKNKESEYKKQLAEKEERRKAVEQELSDYESQLKFLIDPTSYPTSGTKSLYPPLDEMVITQKFGDTEFSRQNAGLYNGKGHNGVDLKASVGTPVKASFAGIVQGIGNTDLVCPGASYGRWVLIKHGNGLTTIYAHLSLIKVNEGDSVETGDLIAYSGNTGYTTGPHLHFGLFATQGIRITNLKSKACNGTYRVPVADYRAYLNPMSYL